VALVEIADLAGRPAPLRTPAAVLPVDDFDEPRGSPPLVAARDEGARVRRASA